MNNDKLKRKNAKLKNEKRQLQIDNCGLRNAEWEKAANSEESAKPPNRRRSRKTADK